MSTTGVRIVKDESDRVLRGLQSLAGARVLVGVPAETSKRKPEKDEAGGPIVNAGLAYLHENGAPRAGIPARPFLVPGVRAAAPDIVKALKNTALEALRDEGAFGRGLNKAGLIAQTRVKKRIVAQEGFAPLSARTLAMRALEGFKGTKALIRTAQLLNSITYVVRKFGPGRPLGGRRG